MMSESFERCWELADAQGWDEQSLLSLLMTFIDEAVLADSLLAFLQEVASKESEGEAHGHPD